MREILFRGKNEKTGKWAFGVPLRCSCRTYIVKDVVWNYDSVGNEHLAAIGETQVVPDTVGQFTGLLDKNGNKIFEGDIVNTQFGRRCKIGWFSSPEHCGWDMTALESVNPPPVKQGLFAPYNLTVIGNVYDNPELLS